MTDLAQRAADAVMSAWGYDAASLRRPLSKAEQQRSLEDGTLNAFCDAMLAVTAVFKVLRAHEDGGQFVCGPHGCRLEACAIAEKETA